MNLENANAAESSVRLPLNISGNREYSTRGEELLWRNAPIISISEGRKLTPQETQKNMRALVASDPYLGELYSWRQMMRGVGQREWKFGNSEKGGVRLGVGAQKLPTLQLAGITGTRAAVAISNDRFGFGTTRPMQALNAAFAPADAKLGEAVSYDQSSFDWATVRPLSSKRGEINLVYLRGQNDLNPNSRIKNPARMIRGTMMGATMNYALPASRRLSGEWLSSNMESRGGDTAWLVALNGPLKHPLGTANVQASYRNIGANYTSFIGTPSDAGAVTKQLAVQQPFGQGKLTGALGVLWTEREFGEGNPSGVARLDSAMQATASTRFQVTPKIALTASHITNSKSLEPETGVLLGQQLSDSQAGVEWKIGGGVAVVMGVGMSRQSTLNDASIVSISGKDRVSLALKQTSPSTTWNLQLSRDALLNPAGMPLNSAESLTLGAERKLTSWLKLGGTYRVCQDAATLSGVAPATDMTAHAALSLNEAGSLELRYRQAQTVDGVRLASGNMGNRGYGVRYQWGAKEGQEGFGLLVDYATNLTPTAPQTQWKLGITYR
jgi:hypothetical protein